MKIKSAKLDSSFNKKFNFPNKFPKNNKAAKIDNNIPAPTQIQVLLKSKYS